MNIISNDLNYLSKQVDLASFMIIIEAFEIRWTSF